MKSLDRCTEKPSAGARGACVPCTIFTMLLFLLLSIPLYAQDGFGFEDASEEAAPSGSGLAAFLPALSIGGRAQAELIFYGDAFSSAEKFGGLSLGNIFSGKLNFKASGSNAEGIINLKLRPDFANPASIVSLDEAYARAFWGAFDLEAGLRKLTWGKADSFGPLDVINPVDYTDLTNLTDILDRKLPRPLIRGSYRLGSFSKVEAVFVPWFQADRYAEAGRWAPREFTDMPKAIEGGIRSMFPPGFLETLPPGQEISAPEFDINSSMPKDMDTLGYAQGGLRFTSTAGPVDFGVQYYSGHLTRPAVTMKGLGTLKQRIEAARQAYIKWILSQSPADEHAFNAAKAAVEDTVNNGLNPVAAYNRYHQIGVDYAQVLGGFNIRAELAAIITGDLAGTDGGIKNPSLGWSVGFDRDLFLGINLNLQGSGSIRLLNEGIAANRAADTEAGTAASATRLTFILSRKFLRDELELKATAIWGVEDMDCYIIPALAWTKGDLTMELSGGIFGGDPQGELGQYRSNSFVKTLVSYSF